MSRRIAHAPYAHAPYAHSPWIVCRLTLTLTLTLTPGLYVAAYCRLEVAVAGEVHIHMQLVEG